MQELHTQLLLALVVLLVPPLMEQMVAIPQ
jgi:hypothetical protein